MHGHHSACIRISTSLPCFPIQRLAIAPNITLIINNISEHAKCNALIRPRMRYKARHVFDRPFLHLASRRRGCSESPRVCSGERQLCSIFANKQSGKKSFLDSCVLMPVWRRGSTFFFFFFFVEILTATLLLYRSFLYSLFCKRKLTRRRVDTYPSRACLPMASAAACTS